MNMSGAGDIDWLIQTLPAGEQLDIKTGFLLSGVQQGWDWLIGFVIQWYTDWATVGDLVIRILLGTPSLRTEINIPLIHWHCSLHSLRSCRGCSQSRSFSLIDLRFLKTSRRNSWRSGELEGSLYNWHFHIRTLESLFHFMWWDRTGSTESASFDLPFFLLQQSRYWISC